MPDFLITFIIVSWRNVKRPFSCFFSLEIIVRCDVNFYQFDVGAVDSSLSIICRYHPGWSGITVKTSTSSQTIRRVIVTEESDAVPLKNAASCVFKTPAPAFQKQTALI